MSATQKDPVLVVLQLTGGNDYLNTVVPYNDPLYRDNRKAVGIGDNQILHIDKDYGFAPYLAPMKKFWDDGQLALMHGVGYLDSPRSHFRSMDIWHTCEAEKVGTEGWLGRVARDIDPKKENVVTTVSFGPCLFRALSVPGVPVACVAGPLEKYGFLPNIQEREQRLQVLERFSRMYKPKAGSGVMEYLGTTGLDSLKGADILKVAPQKYSSTVQYPDSSIARKLKGIAQVHLAGLGSRIFYCDHASFDTHAGQNPLHGTLWTQVTEGLEAFMADLRAAQRIRQRHRPDVLGIRPPRARQRFRNGSRRRRRDVRDRRQGEGRPLRRIPVAQGGKARAGRPQSRAWISAASTRRSSTSGWGWIRCRSSTALTNSLPS